MGEHDLFEKLAFTTDKTQIVPDMISAEIKSMTLISVSRLQLTQQRQTRPHRSVAALLRQTEKIMIWKWPLKTCQESTLNNSPYYTKYLDCGKMVFIIFCEFSILSNICSLPRGKFLWKRLCLASYQCPLFSLIKKRN